jgi:predicted ATPase
LIGEFLARVAAGGPQVFVETHSDHVVNGVRIAHKNAVVTTADVTFFAFGRTDEYESHVVASVPIDENSEFPSRPDYFFDQLDKDLRIIYDLE